MSVVPKSNVGRIEFCETRVEPWVQNAIPMGSSASAVTDWSAKVTAARNAYDAQQAAQLAARDSTILLNIAMGSLMDATASIIKQVRAKADLAGDGVYALASLPVPATPAPVPAPGTPSDFKVILNPEGSLKLKWKCVNPAGAVGTMYQIARRTEPGGAFTMVGASGTRSFTDVTVPSGVVAVTYQIVAVRSTSAGPAAQFTVNFGMGAAGQAVASVAPRLAA